jgi:hypothetical protein
MRREIFEYLVTLLVGTRDVTYVTVTRSVRYCGFEPGNIADLRPILGDFAGQTLAGASRGLNSWSEIHLAYLWNSGNTVVLCSRKQRQQLAIESLTLRNTAVQVTFASVP